MSLMKLFSGPTAEKLEARGDIFSAAGQWGQAKQVYERALRKREKTEPPDGPHCRTLQEKLRQTQEALAREHYQTARDYLDGGYDEEARETLQLALEISHDPAFRETLAREMAALDGQPESNAAAAPASTSAPVPHEVEAPTSGHTVSEEEYFQALCHTLPEDVGRVYQSYGADFVTGYVALNTGEFPTAVAHLERALAAAPGPDTYIPLELATAYANSGRMEEARKLLEAFRTHHPDVLPAYQLLCEIYWTEGDFSRVDALLASLPPELAASRAGMQMKGETLYRAGHFKQARDFYRRFLATHGWHETMALELAKALEALNEFSEARSVYADIMGRCRGCRTRIDPRIKHRYAELSFAEGHRGVDILELYLALARERPEEASLYFDRVSQIYFSQGNEREGERFRAFAARARSEHNPSP